MKKARVTGGVRIAGALTIEKGKRFNVQMHGQISAIDEQAACRVLAEYFTARSKGDTAIGFPSDGGFSIDEAK